VTLGRDAMSQPPMQPPASRSRSWDAGALLAVINGVLAGVGAVYVATHSLPVTVIACTAALTLAGLILILHRERQPTARRRTSRPAKKS
jgi:hypothetical protein